MPPGKGNTCGTLLAGALFGKNSAYTLLIVAKLLPATMKIVVLIIFHHIAPGVF